MYSRNHYDLPKICIILDIPSLSLAGDEAFVSMFIRTLKSSPFDAFFWETPPVTTGALIW
jgi:hypothetical protein